jgi:hypothetical protein
MFSAVQNEKIGILAALLHVLCVCELGTRSRPCLHWPLRMQGCMNMSEWFIASFTDSTATTCSSEFHRDMWAVQYVAGVYDAVDM